MSPTPFRPYVTRDFYGDFLSADSPCRDPCPLDLPETISLEELRRALINVRHLEFQVPMTPETLDRFLDLMPSVTSLSVHDRSLSLNPDFDFQILLPCLARSAHRLTKLFLGDITVDDTVLQYLLTLYSDCLQELRLLPCIEYFEAYEEMGNCTKLRHLYLGQAPGLIDTDLERIITNCPDLEVLDCEGAAELVTGGLDRIHRLKKLRRLGLAFAKQIPSEALCNIGKISTLQHLDLRKAQCDVSFFQSIACLKQLRSLRVGSDDFTSECLSVIIENFVNLEELDLYKSATLTDEDGVKFSRLKKLKSLTISRAAALTDLTFARGFGSPAMERLQFGSCQLTDAGLGDIAAHHKHIKKLGIFHCDKITDSGVSSLLRSLTSLQSLHLDGNALVTDESFKVLLDACPRLRYLWADQRLGKDTRSMLSERRPCLVVQQMPPLPLNFDNLQIDPDGPPN